MVKINFNKSGRKIFKKLNIFKNYSNFQSIEEEIYFKKIHEYDKKYYNLISNFNLNFPKPLNLQEEKKIFFNEISKGKIYNPQIQYNFKNFDDNKIIQLKNLKINIKNDLYGFAHLYEERLKTKIYEIECHKTWGTKLSTDYVLKYRGKPSYFLLQKAKIFCKKYKREKIRFSYISPQEVGNQLKKYVLELTGDNINIRYIDMQSKVNISPSKNLIQINPNEKFTTLELKRLKIHEIGTHYMRYYNGKKFIPNILESGTSNYIETEEGLAAYMEELYEVSSKAQLYIYAGRVIATYYCLTKSFYEIYFILKKYGFKDKDAFTITYRAKRNLSDTSEPGGFTKDYVYFSGYYRVKEFVKKNDIKDLFIGKIKLDDLKLISSFIKKNKKKIKTLF